MHTIEISDVNENDDESTYCKWSNPDVESTDQ